MNILITGASYGLGAEIAVDIAKTFSQSSRPTPHILIVARSADGLRDTCARIEAMGASAEAIIADLSDLGCVSGLGKTIAARSTKIDCFVSCAASSPFGLFEEQDEVDLACLLNVNLVSPLILARALLPSMLARKYGGIVLISSMAGQYGLPFNAAYSASKSGLIKWTQAMRSELRGTGVDVRVICPMSVAKVGVSARGGQNTPWTLGEVTPTQVSDAIIDAILQKGAFERIISSRPVRLLLALSALIPSAGPTMIRMLGVTKMYSAISASRRQVE